MPKPAVSKAVQPMTPKMTIMDFFASTKRLRNAILKAAVLTPRGREAFLKARLNPLGAEGRIEAAGASLTSRWAARKVTMPVARK